MLSGEASRLLIPAQGATHSFHLIRGHGFAVPRTAEDDSSLTFSSRHRFGGRPDEQRVIDGRFIERSAVVHFMSETSEQFLHFFFVTKTGVVGPE
jgi:hypothetical protein